MLKFLVLTIFLIFALDLANAHFPVYSLYKERKPLDLFQALTEARQTKRRAGGFEDNYKLPFSENHIGDIQFEM